MSKTLTLDVSKWRCGITAFDKENRTGEGTTYLLNDYGYMCCLGQFALQFGASKEELLHNSYPTSLSRNYPLISKKTKGGYIIETRFSDNAIHINDNESTTVKTKIKQLKSLCKEHGYKLKVINNP